MIYSCQQSNNDELIQNVAQLYLRDGDWIADITYGKGVFWKKIDLSNYVFFPSDIITCPNAPYDFRNLPYNEDYFDVVVFDPPYVHNPGNLIVDTNYQNAATTKGFYHKDIMELYYKGMDEAKRILKKGGLLWVKCKDEIESSRQYMSHIEIYNYANQIGLTTKDLFVMMQKNNPIVQFKQQHARKNHSYLWIFKK